MTNTLLFISGILIGVSSMLGMIIFFIARETKRQLILADSDHPIGQQLADEMGIELSV